MEFTPTAPRQEPVVETTDYDVTSYSLRICEWREDGGFKKVCGDLIKTFDTSPPHTQDYPFTVEDKEGSTPIADQLALDPAGGDDQGEVMDRAVFEILKVAIDPATGQPYLPAGTVS